MDDGRGLRVVVLDDAAAVARHVADRFITLLMRRPQSVLGLATGGTPIPIYQALVAAVGTGQISFAHAATFNLDEYVGLGADDPASFAWFMRHHLFDHVDIDPGRTRIPDGRAGDPIAEAAAYEAAIAASGGIDLQLLGIGANGHVAFNEPGSDFASRTRIIRLSDATRVANRRFFPTGAAIPDQALTMGIATILEARSLVLAATGAAKASAIFGMVAGPIGPGCPASALRRHPDVELVCDRDAASLLPGGTK
jgi:glucosamine-6-phosphate deaminase